MLNYTSTYNKNYLHKCVFFSVYEYLNVLKNYYKTSKFSSNSYETLIVGENVLEPFKIISKL